MSECVLKKENKLPKKRHHLMAIPNCFSRKTKFNIRAIFRFQSSLELSFNWVVRLETHQPEDYFKKGQLESRPWHPDSQISR
mmetsp:Transcript_1841/g.3294  ORF Transcript_1841/g.3294 Transcript_1841/m.3294 type:complete len:82 (-) Transcript_1841:106-351(-)